MLTLKKHGLTVPSSDDVRATYGDLLNGQADELTKIIDQTAEATTKAMNNTRMGPIERAKSIEQVRDQARRQINESVEGRRKRLDAELVKAGKNLSDREKLNVARSAQSVLNHNLTRALQLVGGR